MVPSKLWKPVKLDPLMDASTFPKEIQGYVHAQWSLYDHFTKAIGGEHCPDLPTMEDALRVQVVIDAIRHGQCNVEC